MKRPSQGISLRTFSPFDFRFWVVIGVFAAFWFHGALATGGVLDCSVLVSQEGTLSVGILPCARTCGVDNAARCACADRELLPGKAFEVPVPGASAHGLARTDVGNQSHHLGGAGEREPFPAVTIYLRNQSFLC